MNLLSSYTTITLFFKKYLNSCLFLELNCVYLLYYLKKFEGFHQETTEKEVERILGYLQCYSRDEREFKVNCWRYFGVIS